MPRLAVALGLAVCLLAACTSDPTGPPELRAAAGTYTLRTINDAAVPTVLGASGVEVVSDLITLTSEGACTETLRTRITSAGTTRDGTDTFACRYSVAGETATLSYSTGGAVTGTLRNGTLAITPDGRVWSFAR